MGDVMYIFKDDIVGGNAIGCDKEEVFWRGRRVDVTDLTLGEQLEIGDIRINQGSSHASRF